MFSRFTMASIDCGVFAESAEGWVLCRRCTVRTGFGRYYLCDIIPTGYGVSYVGGSLNVQSLDASGYMVDGSKYYWYDDEDGTAWFDGSDEEVENEVLNPGEAIWVNANSSSEKLNFPAAL